MRLKLRSRSLFHGYASTSRTCILRVRVLKFHLVPITPDFLPRTFYFPLPIPHTMRYFTSCSVFVVADSVPCSFFVVLVWVVLLTQVVFSKPFLLMTYLSAKTTYTCSSTILIS